MNALLTKLIKKILTDSSLKRTNKLPLFIPSLYLRASSSTFGIK